MLRNTLSYSRYLAHFLLPLIFVVFVLCSPVFELAYEQVRIPIYKILVAVFFISAVVNWKILPRIALSFLREKINWLFACFVLLLSVKSDAVIFQKIMGAICVPWVAGVLIARQSKDAHFSQDIKWFGIILAIEFLALNLFIPNMLVDFPRRPIYHNIAIYLLLGNFLPIVPALAMHIGEAGARRFPSKQDMVYLATCVFLFYFAFLLVGVNSRLLLFFSMLITFLYTAFWVKDRAFKWIGVAIYPLILLVMTGLLPRRSEHLLGLLYSLAEYIITGARIPLSELDPSMAERLNSNSFLLEDSCGMLTGCPFDINSSAFKGAHLWFAQLYYVIGLPGVLIFSALFFMVVKYSIHLIVNSAKENKSSDLYIGLASLTCFAGPFYASSFINTSTFFAMAGLIANIRPLPRQDRMKTAWHIPGYTNFLREKLNGFSTLCAARFGN